MKKVLALVISLIMLIPTFASCTNKNADAPADTSTQTESPATDISVEAAKEILTIYVSAEGDDATADGTEKKSLWHNSTGSLRRTKAQKIRLQRN